MATRRSDQRGSGRFASRAIDEQHRQQRRQRAAIMASTWNIRATLSPTPRVSKRAPRADQRGPSHATCRTHAFSRPPFAIP